MKRLILKVKNLLIKSKLQNYSMSTFVPIGDKLAKSIQPGKEQSPAAHIQPTIVKFRFKPNSVVQATKLIKNLVNSKDTEIHGIPNKALKECAENITPSLTDILYLSVETGIFPDDLKAGRVASVYESDEKDDLNNYRPISA